MLIWFAIFLYALLLLALVYVWIDIIRLFISRRYRQCPPLVPSFGRQKKVMIEKISAELKQNRQPLNVLDPGCGTGTLLIEAAFIALNRAPGLMREFACEGWGFMPEEAMRQARDEARELFDMGFAGR